MAQGLTKIVDIKNVDQQLARVDTDAVKSLFIGGGKSNARNTVGEEFAEITGGTRIDFVDKGRKRNELPDLLEAVLTSSRNEAPGLEGVELVSLSEDTFTLAINGAAGSKNFIEFTGSAAEAAIDSVLFTLGNGKPAINLKNSASQVAFFDTDAMSSIFVGSSNAASAEAKAIIGGSSLNIAEAEDLLTAVVTGKASNGTAGVEGVELVGLTDEGFTLRIDGQAATRDTLIFGGEGALDAIAAADAARGADFKDGHTAFDIFDVAAENREFVGQASLNAVGAELKEIVGGSSINRDEVLEIFEAVISGNGRKGNTHGLDRVKLIGLNDTSFSIGVQSAGGNTDYILFTNVDTLEGAAAFGFGDGPGASVFG
ncbi:hypothetical protein [Vacuolonema iberomarrocanum]|uniref:hypothetical protein n=1 Tax=Vacuolonema iberomarrocanum TaxID=3454632 RepID=UPI0019F15034|nr:hypothetical protein [filamentous cyanobacterium LEGE 07170]